MGRLGGDALLDEFERWLRRHGSTGLFVKTSAGGRIFLAAGETAPYMTATINKFVVAGRAVREGNRVTLK